MAGEGIERGVRLFVHIDIEEAGEGILAVQAILVAGLDQLISLLAEGERVDIRGFVADAGVADRTEIAGDALNDGRRSGLLLDGGLEVALLERFVFEESIGARGAVATIDRDVFGSPIAGESELAPSRDVFGTALAGAGKNTIHLGHREAFDRIVLVHEHCEGIDGDGDFRGLIAELFLEGVALGALHRAAHRAELGGALDQGRRRGGRALAFDLDVHIRVGFFETLGPKRHQVVQRVRTDRVQVSADAADGRVGLDCRIHRDFFGARGCGGESKGGEDKEWFFHKGWDAISGKLRLHLSNKMPPGCNLFSQSWRRDK